MSRIVTGARALAAAWLVLACAGPSASGRDGALERELARRLEQAALLDLRLQADPTPSDYRVTTEILSLATRLDPGSLALAHRLLESAYGAGDGQRVTAATRAIVELDPRDTVAQLRLISDMIGQRQTVEQRLETYRRFLGPGGERLDPALRSRLALDGALLAREAGDTDRFAEMLTLATSLDVTNKDAAALALRFYDENMDDPVGRFELQLNLMLADPIDPNVHTTIATTLAANGLFQPAMRSMMNVIMLDRKRSDVPTLPVEEQRLALRWLTAGPAAVVDELNTKIRSLRAQAQARIDAAVAANEAGIENLQRPEDIRLQFSMERYRALAAHATSDFETLAASLDDLSTTARVIQERYGEMVASGQVDPQAALNQIGVVLLDVQMIRALTGEDIDQIPGDVRALRAQAPTLTEMTDVMAIWAMIHAGAAELAIERATERGEGQVSSLLVARAADQLGRDDRAVEGYLAVARERPLGPIGAWCFWRAGQLAGVQAVLTDAAPGLAELASRIPRWANDMLYQPSSYMLLDVEAVEPTLGFNEPALIRIRLTNIAPIPLGLGPSRPLGSRMLVVSTVDTAVPGYVGAPQPEVVDMARRLRLDPRESLEVVLPVDSGYTGWLVDVNGHLNLRERWRVIQDFYVDDRGVFVPGFVALSNETSSVLRRRNPLASHAAEQLAGQIESGAGDALIDAVLAVKARVLGSPSTGVEVTPQATARLARAAAKRFAGATAAEQALMTLILPTARQAEGMEAFDRVVAARVAELASDADDLASRAMLAAGLLTRVDDPLDPALAAAASHEDLGRLAAILAGRLATNRPTLSRVGAGVADMAGPTLGKLLRAQEAPP